MGAGRGTTMVCATAARLDTTDVLPGISLGSAVQFKGTVVGPSLAPTLCQRQKGTATIRRCDDITLNDERRGDVPGVQQ